MSDKDSILLADIGGTHARFAWRGRDSEPDAIQDITVLDCEDYSSLIEAAQAYYAKVSIPVRPSQALFCVAGIVQGDQFGFTNNRSWEFSLEDVKKTLGLDSLKILNDLEASALAIPYCPAEEIKTLGHGPAISSAQHKPIGVIAPGTGLGVSTLTWDGKKYQAHAGEGGHVTIGAITEREWQVLQVLQKEFDHISAERVCSGAGLENLYHALCIVEGSQKERLLAEDIASRAIDKECALCEEALDMLVEFLARVASDLAVTLGAFGGIYIAGGVAQNLESYLLQGEFRKKFLNKGRFEEYLQDIPTYLVTHRALGILGLSYHA